ncbi:MAG: hypothetical protein M0P11_09015 [Anaerolineaceae bacterium]|nr:hypothetical protein [Anaerolineaceae bacterium]
MNNFYLYADKESLEVLSSASPKIIAVGGDFGYGNFGDILQHIGTLKSIQKNGLKVASVMTSSAISHKDFPSWARLAYQTDAILFISDYPLLLSKEDPEITLVLEIRGIAGITLYGGGFLNEKWGNHALSVVEHFLRRTNNIPYWVSGQQITKPFEKRVIEHINEFKPSLFAVRDEQSLHALSNIGFEADYSFDDATEELLKLCGRIPARRGDGLFIHLNSSDYTANASLQDGLGSELARLAGNGRGHRNVTVFQAFRDTRIDVFDTMETIKQLDHLFPFSDVRLIQLVNLLFDRSAVALEQLLEANFGYSCSYHVTLWLQLAGIPCWLRSSNPFYDQKSRALQVSQSLDEFIRSPRLADHGLNLERRAAWNEKFQRHLSSIEPVDNFIRFQEPADGPAPWPFFYEGKPSLQEKLDDAIEVQTWHRERAEAAEKQLAALNIRVDTLSTELANASQAGQAERERADAAERARGELEGRVLALTVRLTEVGNLVHNQRAQLDVVEYETHAHAQANQELQRQVVELQGQLQALTSQLHQILRTWSWRITRGFRGVARVLRGDFAPAKTVMRRFFKERN